jgi:guanosine-3',5'-bis(diphosphate) 3'-pyrophosphohydrolase
MNARAQLTAWIKQQYAGQKIKRSGEPYFNHLVAVAEMVEPIIDFGYEVGLCHDLLEDTEITVDQLLKVLVNFGYSKPDANYITNCVVELTDVFTKAAYPNLSKVIRKEKEAARLTTISPVAQTVKYADLMDNIKWVMRYDRIKAVSYLTKKRLLIMTMADGNAGLREQVLALIENSLRSF